MKKKETITKNSIKIINFKKLNEFFKKEIKLIFEEKFEVF